MSIEERKKKDRDRKREKYQSDAKYRKKDNERCKREGDKRSIVNQTKAFELVGIFGCSNKDCTQDVEYYTDVDWHHQKPENKTGNLGKMFRNNSWEKVKKELIEGDVIPLCRICHGRLEYKREPIPFYRGEELE